MSIDIEEEEGDDDEESVIDLNNMNLTIDTDCGNVLIDDGDDDILMND